MKNPFQKSHDDGCGGSRGNPVVQFDVPGKEQIPSPEVEAPAELDLASLRNKLESEKGKGYWRTLEEVSESPAFEELLQAEFPRHHAQWDPIDRRSFLKLSGASLALAGLAACTKQKNELIVPYVDAPEEIIPGKSLFFASTITFAGYGHGVLVESQMGRPTKIEGNPEHPGSLGGTDAFIQASILDLYDPDRSRSVLNRGRQSTWDAFLSATSQMLGVQDVKKGSGLRVLTGTVTSPLIASHMEKLLAAYPEARWVRHEPAVGTSAQDGAQLAFGQNVDAVYDFTKADVVLSLESDFLAVGPGRVRYAHDFATRRKVDEKHPSVNRLYVVEGVPSVTGTNADHRLPVRSSAVVSVARALAKALGVEAAPATDHEHDAWVKAVADDLKAHQGSSLVVAGNTQPPVVHALAHAINAALGNSGKTVRYTEPVAVSFEDQALSLEELVGDIEAGNVDMLITLDTNPVYSAPANLKVEKAIQKIETVVHLGAGFDETARYAHWHLPLAHELEAWGDARAYDGTVSLVQPLIEPLYKAKSAAEVLAALNGTGAKSSHELLKAQWEESLGEVGFKRALHDGVVPDSAARGKRPSLQGGFDDGSVSAGAEDLELVFRPDPTTWDGSRANNGWLQETPKPSTKLTWDNVLLVGASTAERLGLKNEDLAEVRCEDRSVQVPVWILPGVAPDTLCVQLGYGRTNAGKVGDGVGYNAYALRTSDSPWVGKGVQLISPLGTYKLASTQRHHLIADTVAKNRNLVRVATTEEYKKHPDFAQHPHLEHVPEKEMTVYPPYDYSKGEQWGMTINLNQCVGCNACLVACQAENNIPVVGKTEVGRGREMHWLRVDQYYEGDLDNPKSHHQPVPCMQCENAPCETVCPVGATVHSQDGLNQMVYNRCVGTRYCSNNCPYKVRRFNFFHYADDKTESLKLQKNPNVTIRPRGVMEKCTYCVQRISAARIEAKKDGRPIAEGEVKTACQQACPTRAISFGSITDPESEVTKNKASKLNYSTLSDINTLPRTTYLARVVNPNPALEPASSESAHEEPHA